MSYSIPLFKLNYDEREENAVLETLRSRWISTGPKCLELEELFSRMFEVKHAISLSNCTNALHLALKVLDIKAGDEVICPSLTFVASVNAIRYVDAVPVFCDITSNTDLNIDPQKIEELITEKTKAILVVHVGGFSCEMDSIILLAKKYNLKIIEDACHAPLSEYKGKKLGTIGDIGCFSFFSNKNISTGEGGMIVTNNDNFASQIKLLKSHGMTTMSYQRAIGHSTSYDVVALGYNYRLDDIHATLAIVQLNKLKEDLIQREKNRKVYISYLKDIPAIHIPFLENTEFTSNYIMPIVLKASDEARRDRVREYLHSKGIQTSVHYPAIHKFSIYKDYSKSLPITEYVTDNEITLPIYSSITVEEMKYISESLREALSQ